VILADSSEEDALSTNEVEDGLDQKASDSKKGRRKSKVSSSATEETKGRKDGQQESPKGKERKVQRKSKNKEEAIPKKGQKVKQTNKRGAQRAKAEPAKKKKSLPQSSARTEDRERPLIIKITR